ncbi:MAG: hypothetical protein ACXWRZ_04510 [Bdellovibrio sp.]
MHYLALFYGARDLAVSGTLAHQRKPADILKDLLEFKPDSSIPSHQIIQEKIDDVEKKVSTLLGPIQLKSEYQNDYIQFEIKDLSEEFASQFPYLLSFINSAAGFLLVVSYESTIQTLSINQTRSPLWQFFRHCRHACAHNGKFHFKKGEPKYPASWGNFTLESILQGENLFKIDGKNGLLSPGDPIRLLWDVEQEYFK